MPDRPHRGPAGLGRVVTEGHALGQLPELLAVPAVPQTEVLLVRGGEDAMPGCRGGAELPEVGADGGPETDHLLAAVEPADPGHGLQPGRQDDSVERDLVLLTASQHLPRLLLSQPTPQELRPPGALRLLPQLRVQRRLPPGEELLLHGAHHRQQVGEVEHSGGRGQQILHAAAEETVRAENSEEEKFLLWNVLLFADTQRPVVLQLDVQQLHELLGQVESSSGVGDGGVEGHHHHGPSLLLQGEALLEIIDILVQTTLSKRLVNEFVKNS